MTSPGVSLSSSLATIGRGFRESMSRAPSGARPASLPSDQGRDGTSFDSERLRCCGVVTNT